MSLDKDITDLASGIFDESSSEPSTETVTEQDSYSEPVQREDDKEESGDSSVEDILAQFGISAEEEGQSEPESTEVYTIEDLQKEDYKSIDLNRLPKSIRSLVEDLHANVKRMTTEADDAIAKAKEMEKGAQEKFRKAAELKRTSTPTNSEVEKREQHIEDIRDADGDAAAEMQRQIYKLEDKLSDVSANKQTIKDIQDSQKTDSFDRELKRAIKDHKVPESLQVLLLDHAVAEMRTNPNDFSMDEAAKRVMGFRKVDEDAFKKFALDSANKKTVLTVIKAFLESQKKGKTVIGKPGVSSSKGKTPLKFKSKGISNDIDDVMDYAFGK